MARKYQRIQVEGEEQLENALKFLTDDMQGENLRRAVDLGAEVTQIVASQLAPRSRDGSHGRAPGFLSRSIHRVRQWTFRQTQAFTHIGMSKDAFYGAFQEKGTIYEPAQPFLRPALDETKSTVVEVVKESLRSRILRHVR